MSSERNDPCPVCGMAVDDPAYTADFLAMSFAFCSRQCLERFLANPHLYVGQPGEPAPAREGRVVLKRRRMPLAQPLSAEQEAILVPALQAMMGMQDVRVSPSRDVIEVTYDLIQATAAQIERELTDIGAQLGDGWAERLRRGFIHYLEEVEVENLDVRPNPWGSHGHGH